MNILRYVIFIPIMFVIIVAVYALVPFALIGLMALPNFWLIVLLIIFGGIATAIFQLLPAGITWLSAKISPNPRFAFYSVLALSFSLGLINIISYWQAPKIDENGLGGFFNVLITCLTIGFASSFAVGAGFERFDENKSILGGLMLVGSTAFYIGIFLVLCLLSLKICYIDPGKSYYWYHGIWHGVFVIPHWVLGWFTPNIYCKAPIGTTAYNVFWWLSFIFVGLGIFSGGSKN